MRNGTPRTIIDMRNDSIELRLRCSQTDKTAFGNKPDDTLWAIEHDMLESMTGSLYSAMHSFLSAPKERRDLILLQRQPETDPTIRRKGEYATSTRSLTVRNRRATCFSSSVLRERARHPTDW